MGLAINHLSSTNGLSTRRCVGQIAEGGMVDRRSERQEASFRIFPEYQNLQTHRPETLRGMGGSALVQCIGTPDRCERRNR